MENQYCYKYPRPAVSADCVLFGWATDRLQVVVIKRKAQPARGEWAFPGGFMDMDETAAECAERELLEETGIKLTGVRQVGAFSAVQRDPRTRVVTIVFYALVRLESVVLCAGDDAEEADWWDIGKLPPLAFDHEDMLAMALKRLAEYLGENQGKQQEFTEEEMEKMQQYIRQQNITCREKYYRDYQ